MLPYQRFKIKLVRKIVLKYLSVTKVCFCFFEIAFDEMTETSDHRGMYERKLHNSASIPAILTNKSRRAT